MTEENYNSEWYIYWKSGRIELVEGGKFLKHF